MLNLQEFKVIAISSTGGGGYSVILEIAQEKYEVLYTENPVDVEVKLKKHQPKWIAFDTETSGLHLKKDRPFLGAVCFDAPEGLRQGFVYVFPANETMLHALVQWGQMVDRVYAHNTVYDLNMIANVIGDDAVQEIPRFGDTMGCCRLIFEAISAREGGDSLRLKEIATKYIDKDSNRYEKAVKQWLSMKKKADRQILMALIKAHGWTAKRFESAINKNTEPLPEEVAQTFFTWQREYPEPTYQDVPMEIMLPYVAVDVILTNILVRRTLPVVTKKQQMDVLEEEFALIPVVFRMSRIGIKVDREYLLESRERITAYIEELEEEMSTLTGGKEFTVNQHAKIKEHYTDLLGEIPESVDKKFMGKQAAKGDRLAVVITTLRTLDKWRSTYIDRIVEGSDYDGRFYATLDQFNPVSGRFSGNLQQQPKKAIIHGETKEELFHPRKAFLADSDEEFDIFLIDFSQVELRFQAHYTLSFGGDLNLCRAYCPFKCVHYQTGEMYDYTTEEGKARWRETKEDGNSAWIVPETGEPWTSTDVHSASTKKALALMGIDIDSLTEKEFATWRGLGKGVNFAKNYGVGVKGAADQFGLDVPVAKALCEGYNEAFPVVLAYQNNVVKALGQRGYVTGIYGRRYYLSDSWRFYKAANYLIQGSCAHDLKQKMLLLDSLLASKKSAMLTCIHDEIVFRIHRSERHLVPEIKQIMEWTPKVNVPIVAEVDYTETNWSDKHKYKELVNV